MTFLKLNVNYFNKKDIFIRNFEMPFRLKLKKKENIRKQRMNETS